MSGLIEKIAARFKTWLRAPLRPPGALTEDKFIHTCIKCRKCMEVCPYKSIRMAHRPLDEFEVEIDNSLIFIQLVRTEGGLG